MSKSDFLFSDTAQQIVGGFLLAGPFVVTEEVWSLAESITLYHSLVMFLIVVLIGYSALYQADANRNPETEKEIVGIPLRLISLILVSYLSVGVLITVTNAPGVFDASIKTTMKVLGFGAIFSEIGAATADSIF